MREFDLRTAPWGTGETESALQGRHAVVRTRRAHSVLIESSQRSVGNVTRTSLLPGGNGTVAEVTLVALSKLATRTSCRFAPGSIGSIGRSASMPVLTPPSQSRLDGQSKLGSVSNRR